MKIGGGSGEIGQGLNRLDMKDIFFDQLAQGAFAIRYLSGHLACVFQDIIQPGSVLLQKIGEGRQQTAESVRAEHLSDISNSISHTAQFHQ